MQEQTASQSRDEREEELRQPAGETGGEEARTFCLRHNRQTVELTLPELLTAAEKGLDYDRIRPSHEYVKRIAAQKGETDVSKFLASESDESKPEEESPAMAEPSGEGAFHAVEALLREYPEAMREGRLSIPDEVRQLEARGMRPLEAYRLYDLKRTRAQNDELRARLEASEANRRNERTSIGSLAGGDAPEKDFVTSKEWDALPEAARQKFIRSGRIFDFMRKWSEDK